METRRKARSKPQPALLGMPSELLPLALSFLPLRCSARFSCACRNLLQLWVGAAGREHVLRATRKLFPPDSVIAKLTSGGEASIAKLNQLMLPRQNTIRQYGGIGAFLAAVDNFKDVAGVQVAALDLQGCLHLNNPASHRGLVRGGCVTFTLDAMRTHARSAEVQKEGCGAISCLVETEATRGQLMAHGALDIVLKALRDFPSHLRLQEYACYALSGLMGAFEGHGDSRRDDDDAAERRALIAHRQDAARAASAIELVFKAWHMHGDNEMLCRAVMGVLGHVIQDNTANLGQAVAGGGIERTLQAITGHHGHSVEHVSMALDLLTVMISTVLDRRQEVPNLDVLYRMVAAGCIETVTALGLRCGDRSHGAARHVSQANGFVGNCVVQGKVCVVLGELCLGAEQFFDAHCHRALAAGALPLANDLHDIFVGLLDGSRQLPEDLCAFELDRAHLEDLCELAFGLSARLDDLETELGVQQDEQNAVGQLGFSVGEDSE